MLEFTLQNPHLNRDLLEERKLGPDYKRQSMYGTARGKEVYLTEQAEDD